MTWPLAITPHAWQAAAYPLAVEALRARKRPVIQACTGSGKSVLIAALAHTVGTSPRVDPGDAVVVSTPTTGLVDQLAAALATHAPALGPERRVLDALRLWGPLSVSNVQRHARLGYSAASDAISALAVRGAIIMEYTSLEDRRAPRWMVAPTAPAG